jgi:hypothetical protein
MRVPGRDIVRGQGEEVELENFTLYGEVIRQLKEMRGIQVRWRVQSLASAKTKQKLSLPCGPNEKIHETHKGKQALAKYKARVTKLDSPRIQKLHYIWKLDFLSQAAG